MWGTINGRPLCEVVHELSKRTSILDEAITLVVEKRCAPREEKIKQQEEDLKNLRKDSYTLDRTVTAFGPAVEFALAAVRGIKIGMRFTNKIYVYEVLTEPRVHTESLAVWTRSATAPSRISDDVRVLYWRAGEKRPKQRKNQHPKHQPVDVLNPFALLGMDRFA